MMDYLTYKEYMAIEPEYLDEEKFDKLINKASDVIDNLTSYYYQYNNLEDDIEFRKNQFKKAIAAQVEYFNNLGGTTVEEIQSAESITIGRTSISKGGRADSKQEKQSIVSEDALMYLKPTGLLYRGIGVIV